MECHILKQTFICLLCIWGDYSSKKKKLLSEESQYLKDITINIFKISLEKAKLKKY